MEIRVDDEITANVEAEGKADSVVETTPKSEFSQLYSFVDTFLRNKF